jgi:hypothetical protein
LPNNPPTFLNPGRVEDPTSLSGSPWSANMPPLHRGRRYPQPARRRTPDFVLHSSGWDRAARERARLRTRGSRLRSGSRHIGLPGGGWGCRQPSPWLRGADWERAAER